MSGRTPESGGEIDLAAIARDDELLDALGRGDPAPEGDDLATMLAAWRDDLGDAVDEQPVRPAVPALPPASPRRVRLGRPLVRVAAAAVVLAGVVTGLGIGSREAGPSSPLWALTQVLHPERAEVRLIEDTIRQARSALAAGRPDEARNLLDEARRRLASVDDPSTARRLAAEIDALRPAPAGTVPTPAAPGPSPTPTTTSPSPPGGTGPQAPTSTPPPSPRPSSSPLVVVPLPELPVLPDLSADPAESSLPGLPLPTLDLLG
ncbi:anti-sigma-D factor RsdA [Micromonospora sp. WMMD558]|uniref:anti-sigma-D factor RsdA n=1 Tax=Micromonospora sp. WMMD558 TaxID=3403462 RepID=UPI003BF4E67B